MVSVLCEDTATEPQMILTDQAGVTSAWDGDAFEMLEGAVTKKWRGTTADRKDMTQLGRVQELRRNFTFRSVLALACTLIATWEVLMTTLSTSLMDGGTAGMLWGFIVVVVGFTFVYLSIAEMASMAPTAAGQYHWVSELAPKRAQKFLSYLVGWLTFTGWQGAITSICFLAGTIVQGLIILNNANYVPQAWHGTLLVIAIAVFAVIFNTILSKSLPLVESLLLCFHVIGFLAITITLWVLAPAADATDVWLQFTNTGGWNSTGTATMVGLLSPILSMIGFDCAVHMSEEIRDASAILPKAMLWSVGFNAALGLVMAITLAFTLGNVDEILKSATGYPFVQIFFNVTNSYAATNFMTFIVIAALTASAIAEIATASRQLWSFARDKGIPGYAWIGYVTPGSNIPLNAVLVSIIVTSLLALVNIGSTAALNAILSLTSVSLLTSYILVIGLLLCKRLRHLPLPPRRWSLGRWGMMVNSVALCFLLGIYVFVFFPLETPTTVSSMNWSTVIFASILVIAMVYYLIHGRKVYVPPVALVNRNLYEQH